MSSLTFSETKIWQIESPTTNDAKEISSLINNAYKSDSFRSGDRTTEEKVRELISTSPWFIIREKNKIIYTVMFTDNNHELTKNQGNIHFLAKDPTTKIKGLSRLLLEKVEEVAKGLEMISISLIAASINKPLVHYYKSQGYIDDGVSFHLPNRLVTNDFKNQELSDPNAPSLIEYIWMRKKI